MLAWLRPRATLALVVACLTASPLGASGHVGRLHQHAMRLKTASIPHKVGATVSGIQPDTNPISTATSSRYLIGSFPKLKQVAYVHLPDNVWRPLVLGNVSAPGAVAADSANGRLYVADPPNKAIWWYHLAKRDNGLLETMGDRKTAAANVTVSWMAANGVGDLYFIGRKDGADQDSVYRQTASAVSSGSSAEPIEMFSRANSGSPDPSVWLPSGIAVDPFHVYWGNQADGKAHGSIVQAPRHDSGTAAQDTQLKTLNSEFDEVRGMTVTGTHIFWVAPDGVHGMRKGMSSATEGKIASAPNTTGEAWMPKSIAFDGDATLYFTERESGVLYQLPALNLNSHQLTKFVDAPNIDSLTVVEFFQAHPGTSGAYGILRPIPMLMAIVMLPLALLAA